MQYATCERTTTARCILRYFLPGRAAKGDRFMTKENKMGVMPVPRLVADMSLPLMLSMLIQSLYNIVDGAFVARLSEDALTATSIAFPVQMLMIAMSVGTSVGVNALLSRTIGEKKREAAGHIAATGALLSIATSLVFVLLGIFCAGRFARLFSDDAEITALCRQYLTICMIFCSGTFLETMCQRFLQAAGNALDSMISLIVGALTNLVLDPIMIFGLLGFPQLGIRGAAVATVIGQWAGATTAFVLNQVKNKEVTLSFRSYRPSLETVLRIYKVGLPTIVTQALGSIMISTVNAILMPYSSTAVAFFGVYYKLQSFPFMPMNGLGQASISIIGYNYGAKNGGRIRETLRVMLPVGVGIALVTTAVFLIFPGQLLALFAAGKDMLEIGVPALRIIAVTFPFAAITMLLGYAVSGLGNGMVNMLGTALRQIILMVPLCWLFIRLGGLDTVWYAMWISEVAAAGYAVFSARREYRKKVAPLCAETKD